MLLKKSWWPHSQIFDAKTVESLSSLFLLELLTVYLSISFSKMARLLRELVRRRPSSNNFIATLPHRDPSILSPPLGLHQPIMGQTKLENGGGLNPGNEGLRPTEEVAHLRKSQIYPSFSFGYFLDPIVPSGLIQSQMVMPVEADMEHPGMIWADSVKKKRKKKMNKHKYKKLRKRLRRKTKTWLDW